MEPQFWIKAWNEGRTAFHQETVHSKLTEYFPRLNPQPGQKVLVPLCGKTKDLLWLEGQGLKVHGVELHEQAVESFFAENKLSPVTRTKDREFTRYSYGNPAATITVSCGDFFGLGETESYDFVYDRAALVALPAPMRKRFAGVIGQCLRTGGKYLLIVYDYDQSKMEGPPFSVDTNEVHALYEDRFTIRLMESTQPANEGPRLAAVAGLKQKVYLLEKVR